MSLSPFNLEILILQFQGKFLYYFFDFFFPLAFISRIPVWMDFHGWFSNFHIIFSLIFNPFIFLPTFRKISFKVQPMFAVFFIYAIIFLIAYIWFVFWTCLFVSLYSGFIERFCSFENMKNVFRILSSHMYSVSYNVFLLFPPVLLVWSIFSYENFL